MTLDMANGGAEADKQNSVIIFKLPYFNKRCNQVILDTVTMGLM